LFGYLILYIIQKSAFLGFLFFMRIYPYYFSTFSLFRLFNHLIINLNYNLRVIIYQYLSEKNGREKKRTRKEGKEGKGDGSL